MMPLDKSFGIQMGWPLAAGQVLVAAVTPDPTPTPTPTPAPALLRAGPAMTAAKAGTGRAVIAFVGDSTTLGRGAGTGTGNYTGAKALNTIGAVAGVLTTAGYKVAYNGWFGHGNQGAATAIQYDPQRFRGSAFTFANTANNTTLGGPLQKIASSTQGISLLPATDTNQFDVYYVTAPGNATGVQISNITGGVTTPLDTFSADATAAFVKKTFNVALGSNNIAIQKTSTSSAGLNVIGFVGRNTTQSEVELWNMGYDSSTITDWLAVEQPWSPLNAVAAVRDSIDLFVVNLTINAWVQSLAVSDFKTKLQTFITTLKGGTNPSDVILQIPFPSDPAYGGTAANQQAYVTAVRELATTNSLRLIDMDQEWPGGWAQANAAGDAYDQLHPSRNGYAKIGARSAAVITA